MFRKFSFPAKAVALMASTAIVAACGLPRSGPSEAEVLAGSVERQGDAYIVNVTPRVARLTATQPSVGFSSAFLKAGVIGSDTISSGDILSVTVFENVRDDPLLGNSGQRVSELTQVQVDGQGYIYIPYAGRIRAAGQTPEGVRQAITRQLEDQTPDPQITVTRVPGLGSTVSVSGQVGAGGVYPIEASSRTLSQMLARSGGIRTDPGITLIRVTRGNQTGQVWLKDLNANPRLDIALRPGDEIFVEQDRRSFMALGSTGSQSLITFRLEKMSALEAIAAVGGLRTTSANPKGVFVLRNESEAVARAVLNRNDLVGPQRMVYVLNLTEPTGLFEARDFYIRDGDTLYVTEAPFVRWQKLLAALAGTAATAGNLASAVESVGN